MPSIVMLTLQRCFLAIALFYSVCTWGSSDETLEVQTLRRVFSRSPAYAITIGNQAPKHFAEDSPFVGQMVQVSKITELNVYVTNIESRGEPTHATVSDDFDVVKIANCRSQNYPYKKTIEKKVSDFRSIDVTDLRTGESSVKTNFNIPIKATSLMIEAFHDTKTELTSKVVETKTTDVTDTQVVEVTVPPQHILWLQARRVEERILIPLKGDFIVDGVMQVGPGPGVTLHSNILSHVLTKEADRRFTSAISVQSVHYQSLEIRLVEQAISAENATSCLPNADVAVGTVPKTEVPSSILDEFSKKPPISPGKSL